jgi:hypothetical protein
VSTKPFSMPLHLSHGERQMDKRDLRTLESWRRTLDQAVVETEGEQTIVAVSLKRLRDAVDRVIARIKRDN